MSTHGKKTILLVEDDSIQSIAVEARMKLFGYEVITVDSGEKAVELALNDQTIDLILMDIMLGDGIDGTDAAKQILAKRDVAIVFLSSYSDRNTIDKVRGITRYGYLLKNSDDFVLESSIEMAFELFDAHQRTIESEEKYSVAFHTSPDAVNINSLEGVYVDINEGFTQLTGYVRDDVIGVLSSQIKIWAIPEDRSILIRKLKECGAVENLESTFRCKNGALKVCLMSARIIKIKNEPHILSITRDITIRKLAEETLRHSEERFKSLVNDMQVGVLLQGPQAEILLSNPKALELLGLSEDQLLGKTSFDPDWNVIHEDGSPFPGSTHPVPQAIASRQAIHNVIMGVYRPLTGDRVWLLVDAEPQYHENNTVKQVVCTFIDINDRKEAERALQYERNLLSTLIDTIPDRVYAKDKDSRYVLSNIAHLQSLGARSQADIVGKSDYDFRQRDLANAYRADDLQVMTSGEALYNREEMAEFPTGRTGTLLSSKVPFRDSNGNVTGIVGVSRDITERRQAEEALRESEQKFRALFEKGPIGVAYHKMIYDDAGNPIDYFFLDANESYQELTGVDPRGKTVTEAFPGIENDPFNWIGTYGKVARTGESIRFEQYLQTNDRWYDCVGYQFKPDHFVAAFMEITKRKQAEDALRESEIKHRRLIENSHDIIYTLTSEGVFTFVSPAWTVLLGHPVEQVVGQSFQKFIHPDDIPGCMVWLQKVFEKGLRQEGVEYRVRQAGGEWRWHTSSAVPFKNETGAIVGFEGTSRDITERKQTELLLAQERERLAVTLRSIGDGVITTDVDGNIVMLNKAAEEMTGWKTDDAAGRPLQEVFYILNELTREPCENPVEKVLSAGNIVELANHTCLISKAGQEIVIADSAAPIRDTQSRIIGVVLVFRDMTEKQKLTDSMQRAQKLESLGLLAGGIAHDFNNMLAGIFGYLDIAKETIALNQTDQVPKYLDKALGVYDRAKGLTQQLLTFSKGGNPIRKTIKLAPLIQHSASFALSGSNVTCQFDLAGDLWLCDCDEIQIEQAIDNIVINGKQAMPLGGTIIISAANVTDQPNNAGNFVRISIQDQGVGMPKEILPKIFDPFFSTKTTGHGLGLATVYSIVQRHGGWVDVQSEPGKGSTFDLFIPASSKKELHGTEHKAEEHKGTGRILVLDDEIFLLEIVSSMLESMGYSVVQSKDGRDALKAFIDAEQSGQPFAVSILDLTIPGGVGGKETAKEMRRVNPHSIIIASSGYSEDPVISNPNENGFSDSIIKPYRKNDLAELMMRITSQ